MQAQDGMGWDGMEKGREEEAAPQAFLLLLTGHKAQGTGQEVVSRRPKEGKKLGNNGLV